MPEPGKDRRPSATVGPMRSSSTIGLGIAIGAGVGLALSVATDNQGLLAVGIAVGVAVGAGLQRRGSARDDDAPRDDD